MNFFSRTETVFGTAAAAVATTSFEIAVLVAVALKLLSLCPVVVDALLFAAPL